jgi:DNA repair protein RadC
MQTTMKAKQKKHHPHNLSKAKNLKQVNGDYTAADISINYKPINPDQLIITSVEDTHALIRKLWDDAKISKQEQFVAFFFNSDCRLIGSRAVSRETINGRLIDVKLLCTLALHPSCSYVVIAHNHSSGNLNPSTYDDTMSLEIQQALSLINVNLLDYFILVKDGYISLADAGWLY